MGLPLLTHNNRPAPGVRGTPSLIPNPFAYARARADAQVATRLPALSAHGLMQG